MDGPDRRSTVNQGLGMSPQGWGLGQPRLVSGISKSQQGLALGTGGKACLLPYVVGDRKAVSIAVGFERKVAWRILCIRYPELIK